MDKYELEFGDNVTHRTWNIAYAPVANKDVEFYKRTIIPRLTPEANEWLVSFCTTFLAAQEGVKTTA